MSIITFPNRAARVTAERTIQEIYRKAIGEAFNRAVAEAAQVGGADFTLGDLLDVAGVDEETFALAAEAESEPGLS